jgi:hypothetical protein
MVESRLAAIARALSEAQGRRGFVQLVGGLALGQALAPEVATTAVAAAQNRKQQRGHMREQRHKRHRRKRGRTGPFGPAGQDGTPGQAGSQGPEGTQGSAGGQGPQGSQGTSGAAGAQGPQGPQGPAGTGTCPNETTFISAVGCVDSFPRSAKEFSEAVTTCANAGMRLPTTAELFALRAIDMILSGPEWSGTVTAEDTAMVVGGLAEGVAFPRSLPTPYHCVAAPSIVMP